MGTLAQWLRDRFDADDTDECFPLRNQKRMTHSEVYFERERWSSHVLVCTWRHGPRPDGMVAAHACGKAWCVNSRHIRWATRSVDRADMVLHGTAVRGERNGHAKLTEADVITIRSDPRPHLEVAVEYGVNRYTIADIRLRRTWKHVA